MINAKKKKHYLILDGLRGVAALVVLVFHIFEMYVKPDGTYTVFGHGYLAVDFFFLLSGFVIAHAYDDRWGKMSIKKFFKRRLIRLHPMIVFGMTLGAICFYFSASETVFPGIANTPVWQLGLTLLMGCLLLPIAPSLDIRGFGEMYPLNGPAWTLFFEYIANILYALVIRHLSTRVLSILVLLAAVALAHFAITTGDVMGGWTLTGYEFKAGMIRLLFPFLAGMLIRKVFKPTTKLTKSAFLLSSIILLVALTIPRFGVGDTAWMNGVYESAIIILLFPFLIYYGASGEIVGETSKKFCSFLGKLSYPLYIIHYPIIYIFYGYTNDNKMSITDAIPLAILTFVVCVTVATLAMKFYDLPVRKYLSKRFG